MFSICMHARSQSVSPLIDGRVNNVLLQTVPDFNEALLQLNTVHTTFIHSMLHNTPDRIIHWIQVLAVWWPEIRTNEVRRFAVAVSSCPWHDETERCLVEGQTCSLLSAKILFMFFVNQNLHGK